MQVTHSTYVMVEQMAWGCGVQGESNTAIRCARGWRHRSGIGASTQQGIEHTTRLKRAHLVPRLCKCWVYVCESERMTEAEKGGGGGILWLSVESNRVVHERVQRDNPGYLR